MFVMSPASHTLHTGPLCQMNIDGRCSTGLQCWSLGNIRDAQHWPACCNTVKLIRGQSAAPASIDWSPLIVSGVCSTNAGNFWHFLPSCLALLLQSTKTNRVLRLFIMSSISLQVVWCGLWCELSSQHKFHKLLQSQQNSKKLLPRNEKCAGK